MSIRCLQNTRAGQSTSIRTMRTRTAKATLMRNMHVFSYTHTYSKTHTYTHTNIDTHPNTCPYKYGAFQTLVQGSQNQGQLCEITRASAQADLYMHTYAHSKAQTLPEVSHLTLGFPCQYRAFKNSHRVAKIKHNRPSTHKRLQTPK